MYIVVLRREQWQVELSLRPHRPLRHEGWWSFSESPWHQLISPALWMLRGALYFSAVTVYSGISLFWDMNNAKLGYLWDLLGNCSMMADGRFLRGHDLNLYPPQYQCLGLLSIWVATLYIRVYSRYLPLAISHRPSVLKHIESVVNNVNSRQIQTRWIISTGASFCYSKNEVHFIKIPANQYLIKFASTCPKSTGSRRV